MGKIGAEVRCAYRAVRRGRGGFHNVRQNRSAPFLDIYKELYGETLQNIGSTSFGTEDDYRRARVLLEAERVAVARIRQARRSETEPLPLALKIEPKPHDVGLPLRRNNFLARFGNVDKYVDGKFADIRSWGGELNGLTKNEQYEALIVAHSYRHREQPRARLYGALACARALHLAMQMDPTSAAALFKKKIVPESRPQANDLSRLAKLMVGESVRIPIDNVEGSTEDRPRPHQLAWHCDDKLVNKIARMLMLFSEKAIEPKKVSTWVADRGGLQACLDLELRHSD